MIVANREESIVGVPVIVPPIEVQVALGIVPVEVRNLAVEVDLTNGALCEKPPVPPPPECFTRAESNL